MRDKTLTEKIRENVKRNAKFKIIVHLLSDDDKLYKQVKVLFK